MFNLRVKKTKKNPKLKDTKHPFPVELFSIDKKKKKTIAHGETFKMQYNH